MLTVDTILGKFEDRYFGGGHKRTNYEVEHQTEFKGIGKIIQQGRWSQKSSAQVQPHLSTLDGILLSHLLVQQELTSRSLVLENFILVRFEVKSGLKAIEDLHEINIKIEDFKIDESTVCAICRVEDMKVELLYKQVTAIQRHQANDSFYPDYLSTHLKDLYHQIYGVSFDDSGLENSIACFINRSKLFERVYSGVGSLGEEQYSLLEFLIVFSQMAEMLAYHIENMSREDSHTLWMKQVKAELLHPIDAEEVCLKGKVRKQKLLVMKDEMWKIYEMLGYDDSGSIRISSKIAQKLPSLEVD